MSETKMPAAEAETVLDEQEFAQYELAYHVLPTVADGEVATVRDTLAAHITDLGGTLGEEETPQRFDLAYDIEQYIEGKNRKFSSAYFGWVRFSIESSKVGELTEAVTGERALLRHLLIRLSKNEIAAPFHFHEALAADKKITEVEEGEKDIDPNAVTATEAVDTTDVDDTAKPTTTVADADTTNSSEAETATTDETTDTYTTK
jgi:ribosomal protein S6